MYWSILNVHRNCECQTNNDSRTTRKLPDRLLPDGKTEEPIAGVSHRDNIDEKQRLKKEQEVKKDQKVKIEEYKSENNAFEPNPPQEVTNAEGTKRDRVEPEILKNETSEAENVGMIGAQTKLADSERKLADEMRVRKEKRKKFTAIIEEEENQLKVLTEQMQSVQDAIKLKELKIKEMKRQRKEMPLLRKFGMQINISKSVLRKERLEDDLSVLKGRNAARRRKIQKYKTKIRYDLQILSDPCTVTVDSPRVTKPKLRKPRPIPACFFVDKPSPYTTKPEPVVSSTAENILEPKTQMKHTPVTQVVPKSTQTTLDTPSTSKCTGNVKVGVTATKCLGSKCSLDTEEVSSLLVKQLRLQESEQLSRQLVRSCSSKKVQEPLKSCKDNHSPKSAITSSSISVDVSTDVET